MRSIIAIGAVCAVGVLTYVIWPTTDQNAQVMPDRTATDGALVNIQLPAELSQNAQIGKQVFDVACASCHGANAVGQDGLAPPLIHKIYEPSHHGDESFQRAAALGVQAHHWSYGNMPAIEGLTRGDVTMIVAYIRELQRSNGIN